MKTRILVIEDNEQNLYLARFLLEAQGCEIIAARTGEEGIKRAPQCRPDVILLDIQLPGMDGYAVAAALRQLPAVAKMPLIAVTSHAMAGDKQRSLEAGCTGYIEKPIDPQTFARQVLEFLPARQEAKEP